MGAIPHDLKVGLELHRGRELHDVAEFQSEFVLMVQRLIRRGGVAPDEADAGGIVAPARKQPHVFEGTSHDKTRADLGAGTGLRRVPVKVLRPAVSEAAKPAERRVPAKLL